MFNWFVRKKPRPNKIFYRRYKEEARKIILERLEYFANQYNFEIKRVAIRDTKRSWGSCSSKGNLNFSYKLLFLSPCLRDYIIVHELCHLRFLNHSQSFWQEVAKIMPDYKIRLLRLRQIEKTLGTSVKSLQTLEREIVKHGCCQYHL